MKVETKPYGTIVVALDVFAEYQPVLQRALAVTNDPCHLHLINVTLPHTYFEPYAVDTGHDLIGDIQDKAKATLESLALDNQIPPIQVHAVVGNAAEEIQRLAQAKEAMLIVMGTHGRSGLRLLLGSTANAVLHGVKCDVLAVKI